MKGKRRRAFCNRWRAVAILNIGPQNVHTEQEAERVDEDIALAPRDSLAGVK